MCVIIAYAQHYFHRLRDTVLTETSKCARYLLFPKVQAGPVDQLGMIAAFATRKPRVQIPPGPFGRNPKEFKSHLFRYGLEPVKTYTR